jgi:RND family efflux transporter MFP subunit
VTLVSLALLVAACGDKPAAGLKYHCPMHPTYIADKPGDCPICGMRLVPIEEKTAPATEAKYTCPMHPEVVSDKPGRCPKCGMELVPADGARAARETTATEAAPGTAAGTATGKGKVLYYRSPMDPKVTSPVPAKDSMGMDFIPVTGDEAAAAKGAVEDHAAVSITADGLRLAGIQTAPARREAVRLTIRTVGTVVADETRIRHVHTKVSGYIEKLHLDFTGQAVRQGQPILSIYSPELLAGQEEYLRAREAAARLAGSALPEVKQGGQELVDAARRRLELFDVPESFIAELDRTGKPRRTVTLAAPVTGFVTGKQVFEGQQIDPSMELYTVTDLSRIWIDAFFYEYEARAIRLGQKAVFTMPYYPGRELSGKVAYIDPTLNAENRTLKVRFDFENAGLSLKPGMYASVDLAVEYPEGVVVPDSAVMDTGVRRIVFVDPGDGTFVPREVTVGVRGGGDVQVLSGVAAGERVVVAGNFLLDSESRLRAAIAGAAPADAGDAAKPAPSEHGGH